MPGGNGLCCGRSGKRNHDQRLGSGVRRCAEVKQWTGSTFRGNDPHLRRCRARRAQTDAQRESVLNLAKQSRIRDVVLQSIGQLGASESLRRDEPIRPEQRDDCRAGSVVSGGVDVVSFDCYRPRALDRERINVKLDMCAVYALDRPGCVAGRSEVLWQRVEADNDAGIERVSARRQQKAGLCPKPRERLHRRVKNDRVDCDVLDVSADRRTEDRAHSRAIEIFRARIYRNEQRRGREQSRQG